MSPYLNNPRLMPYKFYASYTFVDIFLGPRCLEHTHDFPPLGSSSSLALYRSAWCYWGCQVILSPYPSWLPIHNHDLPILPPKHIALAPSSICTYWPVSFPAHTIITTYLHYCSILLFIIIFLHYPFKWSPDSYFSTFSSVQAEGCFQNPDLSMSSLCLKPFSAHQLPWDSDPKPEPCPSRLYGVFSCLTLQSAFAHSVSLPFFCLLSLPLRILPSRLLSQLVNACLSPDPRCRLLLHWLPFLHSIFHNYRSLSMCVIVPWRIFE